MSVKLTDLKDDKVPTNCSDLSKTEIPLVKLKKYNKIEQVQ